MVFTRQSLHTEIREWLSLLDRAMIGEGALRRLDSAVAGENFTRDLLNLIYGWKLENANFTEKNKDSYDLCDADLGIAIQVTKTTGAAKIRKTLKTFIPNHSNTFTTLKFFYPCLGNVPRDVDFSNQLEGYNFKAKRDCLCLDDVLQAADNMEVSNLRLLLEFLGRELKPLDRTLSTGVDRTMDAMIACIAHMSETSPDGDIDFFEATPDQQAKFSRLQQDAKTFLSEYRLHQAFHVTLSHARIAVGYDTVRAAKIQKWLQIRSQAALEKAKGDAVAALDTMAKNLLQQAHESGTDAEEDAIRFLLADELIRCNVFPNPIEL